MTESGLPSSLPDDIASSAVGPRPRVAGTENTSRTAAGEASQGLPEEDQFWSEDDEPTRAAGPGLQSQLRTLIEWVAVAVGALAVALLIKAFLLQAFYIPSASMEPTLQEDDRVLVNKLSYRVGDVRRGDIVVFSRPPGAPGDIDDFIKRVIALPGETISFSDGSVFIDGQALGEEYVEGSQTTTDQVIPGCDNTPAVTDTCRIPDGMVFVMGDNREASWDSRRFGPIPEATVVGRAFLKVWPIGDLGFI